jgi:hypothetical protein
MLLMLFALYLVCAHAFRSMLVTIERQREGTFGRIMQFGSNCAFLHMFHVRRRLIMRDRSAYYIPCTAFGAMQLLQRHNIEVMGKSAVVLGDSNVVKPASLSLCYGL